MGRKTKPVIAYEWRGTTTLRSNPGSIKRVPVAIKNSGIFGMASRCGKILRSLLQPILPQPVGNQAVKQRLQEVLRKWLQTDPLSNEMPSDQLPFFNAVSLSERLEWNALQAVPVTILRINGQLLLQLGEFDPTTSIKAPPGTQTVALTIAIAGLGMKEPLQQEAWQQTLWIPYVAGTRAASDLQLPTATGTGKLSIVAMGVRFFTSCGLAEEPASKPTGIVGSFFN